MFRLLLITLVLGATAPSTTFGQDTDLTKVKKNRFSVQTGLFHCFFDKTPVLNVNYPIEGEKPFRGVFYNSVGVQYSRKIHQNSSVSVEYSLFYEGYQHIGYPNLLTNVVSERNYNIFNITYERLLSLKSNLFFTYGSGLNCRYGTDFIVVGFSQWGGVGSEVYEPHFEVREVGDIGLNARVGIEYTPLKWLTIYSKMDLTGFVYMRDKNSIQELQDLYGYKNYPHRFDLSWRFGIGFNF